MKEAVLGSWLVYVNVHRGKSEGLPWVIRPNSEGWERAGEDGCVFAEHVSIAAPISTVNAWDHTPDKPLFLIAVTGELTMKGRTAFIR